MRKVTYKTLDGKKVEVEYDETAPCICCNLPVESASMGGTALCPWCDCGEYRNGERFTLEEIESPEKLRAKAKQIVEKNKEDWEKIKHLKPDIPFEGKSHDPRN